MIYNFLFVGISETGSITALSRFASPRFFQSSFSIKSLRDIQFSNILRSRENSGTNVLVHTTLEVTPAQTPTWGRNTRVLLKTDHV